MKVINHLPLHDEVSGIRNLNTRQRPHHRGGGGLLLGIVIGFAVSAVIFVIAATLIIH